MSENAPSASAGFRPSSVAAGTMEGMATDPKSKKNVLVAIGENTLDVAECPEHGLTLDPRAGWCTICRAQPRMRRYVALDSAVKVIHAEHEASRRLRGGAAASLLLARFGEGFPWATWRERGDTP